MRAVSLANPKSITISDSALVQSREVDRQSTRAVAQANKYNAIESGVALFASFWINLFVVGCYSATFFEPLCAEAPRGPFAKLPVSDRGFNESECEAVVGDGVCCGGIGLAQTEAALEGTLGSAAKYVWAAGLLAAGQASTMTGVFAGQFVMEGFLQLQIPAWQRLALTRSIALVPALLVALATQSHPRVSDDVDQWLNILQAVQLPFALLPVLRFTSSSELMGEHKNGGKTKAVCWALALFVIGINIFTIVQYVSDPDSPTPYDLWFFIFVGVCGVLYLGFILWVALFDKDLLWGFGWCFGWCCGCCRGRGGGGGLSVNDPLLGGA